MEERIIYGKMRDGNEEQKKVTEKFTTGDQNFHPALFSNEKKGKKLMTSKVLETEQKMTTQFSFVAGALYHIFLGVFFFKLEL